MRETQRWTSEVIFFSQFHLRQTCQLCSYSLVLHFYLFQSIHPHLSHPKSDSNLPSSSTGSQPCRKHRNCELCWTSSWNVRRPDRKRRVLDMRRTFWEVLQIFGPHNFDKPWAIRIFWLTRWIPWPRTVYYAFATYTTDQNAWLPIDLLVDNMSFHWCFGQASPGNGHLGVLPRRHLDMPFTVSQIQCSCSSKRVSQEVWHLKIQQWTSARSKNSPFLWTQIAHVFPGEPLSRAAWGLGPLQLACFSHSSPGTFLGSTHVFW